MSSDLHVTNNQNHEDVTKPIVIRVSLGVQSLMLAYWFSRRGYQMTQRPWACVFSDTGCEHGYTYRELKPIRTAVEAAGGVWITADGPMGTKSERAQGIFTLEELWDWQLSDDGPQRIDQPPLWKLGGGRTPSRCTRVAKIARGREAIRSWCAEKLGYSHLRGVEVWIGYTYDEWRRVNKLLNGTSPKWEEFRFPLLEARLTREKTRGILKKTIGRTCGRSLCKHCGYKSALMWRQTPMEDRSSALRVDRQMRDGADLGLSGELFLARERKPLAEIFDTAVPAELPANEYEPLFPAATVTSETPVLSDFDFLTPSKYSLSDLIQDAMHSGKNLLPLFQCSEGACDL